MNLAPNGKPSNLTPEQYRFVRTPAFKAWFGDWERLAIAKIRDSGMDEITLNNISKDVSKVVDENGEPLVVYHGSKYKFNIFEEKPKNIGTRLTSTKGFYFTKNIFIAEIFANKKGFVKSYFIKITNYPTIKDKVVLEYSNIDDYLFDYGKTINRFGYDGAIDSQGDIIVWNSAQIKLADGTNTTFDGSNPDIRYADGGNFENKETYKKWKSLVNMSKGELEKFYNSQEGKDAGLSSKEASEQGISSGRESARWIMKMKETPMKEWTPTMWRWAKKQISFVSRMSGNKGGLYDDKGNKTRKHTSLLIWGHNPEKYEQGANIENKKTNTMDKAIEVSTSEYKFSEFYEWFKNYIPSSLYEESWASEMRRLNSLILDNKVEDKITFTDSRLVLISFMALNQSDVIKGGMREWWIVRRYLEQYSDNNSVQGTDLFEFVDKYIGYTFTDATMNEETMGRVETLKLVLSKHIKDDSIMIPYFVKHEIMSNIKEDVVEKIIEEKAPEEEIEEVSVEEKWQGLKDFAEMMMEDAEGEVLEKWQGLYDFCELMLEK